MRVVCALGLGMMLGAPLDASAAGDEVRAVQVVSEHDLAPGPSTAGITRQFAFQAPEAVVMLAQSKPAFTSGWHNHTDHDVFGYVVSGTVIFESAGTTMMVRPGEFFHVPPHTVHRETNPSTDQSAQVVLFITGSGPMVENVADPEDR